MRPSLFTRPDGTRFAHTTQTRYLPTGCALWLAVPVATLALVLFVAFAVHPQGVLFIPWLMSHL